MSLQVCPACGERAITWSVDEDEQPWTRWWCGRCGYKADEDEQQEEVCPHCGQKARLLLRDSNGFHRWCANCGLFEATEESFGR
jgi:DNA-directed RNA polymerase subunit RPC12/RpoP